MIVMGFAPLVYLGLKNVGGWDALKEKLIPVATAQHFAPDAWSHSWKYLGSSTLNPMGVNAFSMIVGLGFVLSFGYWCTDFLVVQRAMAANSMNAARRTPLIAAVPKMLFPILVILPGMIAIALHTQSGGTFLPVDAHGTPDYNLTIPTMLAKYFPTGILGIGFTALMASFMSGMAGNVTAFNTVWTYDIYQSYIASDKSDAHYLWMGRMATVAGIFLSIAAAVFARQFNNIMDALQLVFGFVNAPLFATFLLGMFWKRATGHGAFWGLVSGDARRVGFPGLIHRGKCRTGLDQGWLDQADVALPQRDGPEFRDRHHRVGDLHGGHDGHLPGHPTPQNRRRIEGPRLLAHAQARGRKRTLVSAARRAGGHHPAPHADPEHHLRLSCLPQRPFFTMSFDLRIPVGLMFTIFGLILLGVGLFGGAALPEKSLGININLWWGLFQLCFGVLMLLLAFLRKANR